MADPHTFPKLDAQRREKTLRYKRFMRKMRRRDSLRLWRETPGGLPSLIVIGAQKSGTTSLHQMLDQHPGLHGNPRKELHFFNENFFRGEKWYRTFYPPQDTRVFFDITPCYLCHPYAAERMAQLIPDAKLVTLLREPASRALSQYWMEYTRSEEHLDIDAAFAAEDVRLARYPLERLRRKRAFSKAHFRNGYVWRGLYAEQLERFYRYFDRDQILVRKAEDLNTDPLGVFSDICDFAGVPHFTPEIKRANESLVGDVVQRSPRALYLKLLDQFAAPNARLERLTGINWETPDL